jgi:nitrogen fixation/metabolism regulation signal transduction histidine kinase
MDKLIKVYNQMIDQLREERTKQEEQHYFLEKLIATSPTGIITLDHDGKIIQVNPMAGRLLGVDEITLKGRLIEDIDHTVFRKARHMNSGTSAVINIGAEATFKIHKSHFVDRGFPRHFIMIEVLTVEILEAEKNAYGKVIRMMAHEVNNTIGPVNSIMQSAFNRLAATGNETRVSEALEIAVERNNNLNVFMRNFADLVRLPPPARTSLNVVQLIKSVGALMETKAGEKQIEFHYTLPDSPFVINGDQQQLEQVFINVIKNAMEAIDGSGKVLFSVDVARRTLIIADTGKGISDDVSDNLFKPFYSTKKDGQGIGLTLIREVLFSHGFTFSLKTTQPGMTEFQVFFNQG